MKPSRIQQCCHPPRLRLLELSRLLATDNTLDPGRLTLGDYGFPVTFAWIDAFTPVMGLDLEWPQKLNDYRAQVEAHGAVRAELSAYASVMRDWLASKTATR